MFYLLTTRNVNSAEQNSLLRTLKTQIFKNSHSLNQTHISTITFSNWIYWCDYSSFISSDSLIVSLSLHLLVWFNYYPLMMFLWCFRFNSNCCCCCSARSAVPSTDSLMYLLKQFRLTIEAILDKPTALVVAINGSQLW